ncbi:subtilisin-like serine protease [Ceratobasidium sp. 392]|nr:subtilisin-like serine protease [Ceratobasidium sp. 392]
MSTNSSTTCFGALDFGTEAGTTASRQLTKKAAGGAGVDIYFLDTGINVAKPCFGGRAVWGKTFGGGGGTRMQTGMGMCSGKLSADHGTALAASALCASTGGTATSAKGIAVKVLSDSGSGTASDIISGINWVVTQYKATGRPSVAVLALGGGASTALDNSVASAVSAGVHTVVTAGFSNVDLANTSPARVATAVTVGSLQPNKARHSSSNHGPGLDVWSFCPTTCPSDIPGCNTPTNSVSYVAGYLAVAIGSYGNKTPEALTQDLISHAVADVTGAPSGTT